LIKDDESTTIKRDAAMMTNFKTTSQNSNYKMKNSTDSVFSHATKNKLPASPQPFATQLKGDKTTTFVSYTIDSAMFLPKTPTIHRS
jgi:hypothetical protein